MLTDPTSYHALCYTDKLQSNAKVIVVAPLLALCDVPSVSEIWRCLGEFEREPINECVFLGVGDDFNYCYSMP